MAKQKQKRLKTEGDFFLLILTMALCIFGLIMVYSASYYFSLNKYGNPTHYLIYDGIYMLLGWIFFCIAAGFDYHRYYKWTLLIAFVGLGLLILVLLIGETINNAKRWIAVGPVTIMPGEIIKTCLIFGLAGWFSRKKDSITDLRSLAWVAVYLLAVAGLFYFQPNFSTAGVTVGIAVLICFAAGLPKRYLFALGGLALIVFCVLVMKKGGYVFDRIRTTFNPWEDALGDGYQVVQGLLALGSGGVLGKGLGGSVQKALYLPEPMNDYILSIIGEELGYVGILLLLLTYLLLLWRIFRAAVRAADRYGMLIAAGVGIHIAVHVILNVAIVSASFIPTGIILPFVSYGGNALVLFIAEAGVAYNVSRYPSESCVAAEKKTEASI